MKTIKITPRGLCHGVVNAINTITKLDVLSTPKPIYILGLLVHNKQILENFEEKGIITLHDPSKTRLELLEEIYEGTVIFTAHGISPLVKEKALEKGLNIIDTTCGDVTKTQELIKDYINQGYSIIYIGKKNHPESEAADGLHDSVHLVTTYEEIDALKITGKIMITNQTTMSIYDVYQISEYIKQKFPQSEYIDEICNATRIRQEAIINQEPVDHLFVVGDTLSNNSNRLVQVSIEQANIPATLIETIDDLDIEFLKTLDSVSVSSGASTPTKTTKEVITFLENFDKDNPQTHIK
jgi:4-hydroxy-3-methylbut-2-enyl diphosphate reductase